MTDCEHDWRRSPHLARLDGRYEAVCLQCWASTLVDQSVTAWTDEDYWAHEAEVESRFGAGLDAALDDAVRNAQSDGQEDA